MQQLSSKATTQTYKTQYTRNKNTATDESDHFQEGHVSIIVYIFEPCLVNILTYVWFTAMCQTVLREGRWVSGLYIRDCKTPKLTCQDHYNCKGKEVWILWKKVNIYRHDFSHLILHDIACEFINVAAKSTSHTRCSWIQIQDRYQFFKNKSLFTFK